MTIYNLLKYILLSCWNTCCCLEFGCFCCRTWQFRVNFPPGFWLKGWSTVQLIVGAQESLVDYQSSAFKLCSGAAQQQFACFRQLPGVTVSSPPFLRSYSLHPAMSLKSDLNQNRWSRPQSVWRQPPTSSLYCFCSPERARCHSKHVW